MYRLYELWRYWGGGIRLYIALAALWATLDVWWWAAVSYGGSNLVAIRCEEVFAWMALGLLSLTLAIGPLYRALPALPGRRPAYEARRMLGVSAAWFASLHASIIYIAQFKLAWVFSLPPTYRLAVLLGGSALIILLALAFTSFDAAMRQLGRWWFRLHRLLYAAIVLVLWHAFLVGSQTTLRPVLVTLASVGAVIFGLHVYAAFGRGRRPSLWQAGTLVLMLLLLIAVYRYGFSREQPVLPDTGKAGWRVHE